MNVLVNIHFLNKKKFYKPKSDNRIFDEKVELQPKVKD